MPFTLAHPALALPFTRSRYISATALIVGSMIPDVEYFITMRDECHNVHTFAAVFYMYLPLTVLISLIYHNFIRRDLIANLPLQFRQEIQSLSAFDFNTYLRKNLVIFLCSALLGIGSHFLWDSVTHLDTPITRHFSAFYGAKIWYNGSAHTVAMTLQYASSIIGLFIVACHLCRACFNRTMKVLSLQRSYWLTAALIFAIVLLIRVMTESDGGLNYRDWIISGTTALFISLSLCGGLTKFFESAWQQWRIIYSNYRIDFEKLHESMQQNIQPLQESIQHVLPKQQLAGKDSRPINANV